MKLLYVHALPVAAPAANAVQVLKMCQALGDCGIDVTLAVPQSAASANPAEHAAAVANKLGRELNFKLDTYEKRTLFGRFQLIGGYFSVKRMMQAYQPDVVFLRNVVFVRAAEKTATPYIYEAHNSLMHNTSAALDKYWTNYVLNRASSPLMRKFVTISGALGEYWETKGIPQDKQISLHDGFDPAYFSTQVSTDEARRKLDLPIDGKIVLYMGSLYADRGIDRIIELAEQIPDATFLIVGGKASEIAPLENLAMQRGLRNIRFVGSVEHKDVPLYLFAADILLMIWSRQVKTIDYCSPLKLFEYMAAGRIIVGHGFRTIKEVLTHGTDAYLVDPDEPEDLFVKLRQALDEMPEEFGTRARQLAFERYTWNQRARDIVNSLDTHADE